MSAGVSLIERIASGVPSLTIMTSTNQLNQLRLVRKSFATETLKNIYVRCKSYCIYKKILLDYKYRKSMHKKTKDICLKMDQNYFAKILKYYDEFCCLKSKNEDWK